MEVAQALWFPYTEYKVELGKLFGNQSQRVIDEGLMIAAEWRDVVAIKTLHNMGANLHYVNKAGFSVLETILQGHDGYWRENVESAKNAVFYMHTHGVTRKDITHGWIIEQCCDVFIAKDKYLQEFLVPPKYTVWWHKPEDDKLTIQGEFDKDPMCTSASKWKDIPAVQFLYIVKKDKEYKRYIITRGFGDATVIPLSETPEIQNKLSWLTTTLMGALDAPEVPGEYAEDE
jgi:hypothetical protein